MFVVEAVYTGGPAVRGKEDQTWTFDERDGQDLEQAAQRFESEAEAPYGSVVVAGPKPDWPEARALGTVV